MPGPSLLPLAISLVQAYPIGWLVDRYHPLRLTLIALLCGWMLDRLNHDYRFIYLWAAGLALLGLLAYVVVYRRFIGLGGIRNYVPP
jgi:hypothetical protein